MDFTYKGTTAASLGVIVNRMNWFVKPSRSVDTNRIQGRDGAIVTDDSYNPISIETRITLTALTNVDAISAWLTGNGVLSFSGDTGKYRNAYVVDEVKFTQSGSVWEASFEFYCPDPYRYVTSEATVTKTTFPASYTNAGTVVAKPLLKVTGTGTVSVTIGANTMSVILDTAYVYIDTDAMDVYHLTTLKNRNSTGTFPTLAVGSNTISVTGTVTEIIITPRTRYL